MSFNNTYDSQSHKATDINEEQTNLKCPSDFDTKKVFSGDDNSIRLQKKLKWLRGSFHFYVQCYYILCCVFWDVLEYSPLY